MAGRADLIAGVFLTFFAGATPARVDAQTIVVDLEAQPAGPSRIKAPMASPFTLAIVGLPVHGYSISVNALGSWTPWSSPAPSSFELVGVRPAPAWTSPPSSECHKTWSVIETVATSADPAVVKELRGTNAVIASAIACNSDWPANRDVSAWHHALRTRMDPTIPRWSGTLGADGRLVIKASRHASSSASPQTWDIEVAAAWQDAAPSNGGGSTPFARRASSELEWVISEVTRDIAEMALFASGAPAELSTNLAVPLLTNEATTLRAVCSSCPPRVQFLVDVPTKLAPHPWSIDTYRPWTDLLFKNIRPMPSRRALPSIDFFGSDIESLIGADRLLSRALTESPRDSSLHDQAALLLGAMALRNTAGRFGDVRWHLNRMAAHLAVAEGLSKGRTAPDHRVGLALIELLSGRTRDARARAEAIDASKAGPQTRTWTRVIRLAATNDWRVINDPIAATSLEKSLLFTAFLQTHDELIAMERSAGWLPDTLEIAERASLEAASVQLGRRYAEDLIESEIDALQRSLKRFLEREPSTSETSGALEGNPRRAVTLTPAPHIEVVGWGFWSARFRGQLLAAAEAAGSFQRRLGLPITERLAGNRALEGQLAQFGGGLQGLVDVTAPWDDRTCRDRSNDIQKDPGAVSFGLVEIVRQHCPRVETGWPLTLPPGTAYMAAERLASPSLSRARLQALEGAIELNPFDLTLLTLARTPTEVGALITSEPSATKSVPVTPTPDHAAELRTLSAYNGKAIAQLIARGSTAAERPALYTAWESYSTEALWISAGRAEREGRVDDAVRGYERLRREEPNRILLSSRMDFLADRYLETGRAEEALVLSQDVAAVGSAGGLLTRARVFERLSRFQEARDLCQTIKDRYGEAYFLDAFHVRRSTRQESPATEVQIEAIRRLFPQGLTLVKPPASGSGVRASTLGSRTRERLGKLGASGTILWMDGYLVTTPDQVSTVFTFTDGPTARALVDQNGVREVTEAVTRFKYDVVAFSAR
ncbi:MAG: hypothetical protein ABI672_09200 [Vicinamibacteria bacterium]